MPFASALFIYLAIAWKLAADFEAGVYGTKVNGFILAAAAASLYLLAKAASERPRGVIEEVAAGLAVLCLAAGYTGTGALLFGLFLCLTGARGSFRAAGGVIMIAVGLRVFWAPLVLHLIAPVILPMDAALTYHLASLTNAGVTVAGTVVMTSPTFGIDVQEGCSSFHNISFASLALVTVAMLRRRHFEVHDLTVMAVAAVVLVAMNVIRLSLMVPDEAAFAFWHTGPGSQGLTALGTFLVIVLAMVGVPWASRMASAKRGEPITADAAKAGGGQASFPR